MNPLRKEVTHIITRKNQDFYLKIHPKKTACKIYSESPTDKIIHGSDTDITNFPWMVFYLKIF